VVFRDFLSVSAVGVLRSYMLMLVVFATGVLGSCVKGDEFAGMRLTIDARDLPRKLVSSEVTLPLKDDASQARQISLWYPKWVPGSHGPGGPIANVAGLIIEDGDGNELVWRRTAGEVYRVEVEVPAGVSQLAVFMKYICNQPTTTSMGHDCFGTPLLGLVSPGSLLMYVEGMDVDVEPLQLKLELPAGWAAAVALKDVSEESSTRNITYQADSLRTVVDSPIMMGKYLRQYDLTDDAGRAAGAMPHRLHVFGDTMAGTEMPEELIDKLRSMVTQTALLTGSQPFESFDILLAATDGLSANGLEHARSSMNMLPPAALQSLATLKGWNRLLIPHEYLHAWCGKYRQPAGMTTRDFHSPLDTELLWVYEGLTQYLGELVEARIGLMSVDEFRARLAVELRQAKHQQGRRWRTLADTAAASHVLRDGSAAWPGLRRSQDYYMEGMLFWLEADAIIRTETQGNKSLDDFCRAFFAYDAGGVHPRPYDRAEIINGLVALVPSFDWDGLVKRRIESSVEEFDATVAQRLGYRFFVSNKSPDIPANTFRQRAGIDAYDSLGATFSLSGDVVDLLLDSPADKARLSPGMKILGVNGRKWSHANLVEAMGVEGGEQPIELLMADGDILRTIQLHYFQGPQFWTLEKPSSESDDLLLKILQAREATD
jgi:predicted metalloprotease with PDZ domain